MTRVALVTGAANGIGRATCLRLVRDGHAIGVLDIVADEAEQVVAEIVAAGGRAVSLVADVSRREDVAAAATTLREAFGPITVLVNNAGISRFVPFLEITDEQWDEMLRVNLKSAFIVTQTVIPDMISAEWGRVINIASSSAQSGAATMVHYSSSKGGIIAFTRSLAKEFGNFNITSNTIPPRFVYNTKMSIEAFDAPEKQADLRRQVEAGPIRRHGEPEDVAGAVAWLASEEAGYVTGQVIGVNGGRYI